MEKHAGTFIFGHSGPSINYGDTDSEVTFDQLADEARDCLAKRDKSVWRVGDLINIGLGKELGSVTDFAKHVGEDERKLQNYAQLAAFYPDTARLYVWCKYTHYKYARQFAGENLNQALEYMEYAETYLCPPREFYKWLCEQVGRDAPVSLSKAELQAQNTELKELLMEAAKWLDGYTPSGLLNRIEETLARLEA